MKIADWVTDNLVVRVTNYPKSKKRWRTESLWKSQPVCPWLWESHVRHQQAEERSCEGSSRQDGCWSGRKRNSVNKHELKKNKKLVKLVTDLVVVYRVVKELTIAEVMKSKVVRYLTRWMVVREFSEHLQSITEGKSRGRKCRYSQTWWLLLLVVKKSSVSNHKITKIREERIIGCEGTDWLDDWLTGCESKNTRQERGKEWRSCEGAGRLGGWSGWLRARSS